MVIDLLLIGIAVALDPLPLTAYIVVSTRRGARARERRFIFGWLLSLAAVLAITVAATGNKPPKPSTAPSEAALAVKIAIGVGLLFIALRQRRRQGKPKKPKPPPKWQAGVDNMSPWFAIGLAPLLQPWGLVAAGVATVMTAHVGSAQSWIALVAFCVIANELVPVHGAVLGLPPRARQGDAHRASVRGSPRTPIRSSSSAHSRSASGSSGRARTCSCRSRGHLPVSTV